MSDNLIRCIHENGKVCFLTKAATENRNFMKKYGIRVEHVERKDPNKNHIQTVVIDATEVRQAIAEGISEAITEIKYVAIREPKTEEPNREAEAEAVDKQVAEALAEAKPKRKPRTTKKPTKK